MKIALLTLGTRGDVQPYAILGRALKASGHQVTLSTGKNFKSLAAEYELEFAPVEADFQALINSDEGKAMIKNPFTARKHFATIVQPMMVDAMKRFYEISKESDCVLYHVKSLGDFFADQFPDKMIRANVVPAIQPTDEFPNPVFSGLSLPKFLNRFTYKLSDLGLAMMNKAVRDFRKLSSLPAHFPKKLNLPSIYGIGPSFLQKPLDFPSNSHFTGFWQADSSQEIADDREFISSGTQTVVITFGSMIVEDRIDLSRMILNLSKALKVNILLVKGWGFDHVSGFDECKSIKVIQSAPFDKLFPLVNAVVHHGGIGTIAQCLSAGVPFFSCPVIYPMGDQHFWGKRAFEIGCSPAPVPLRKLTESVLIRNVVELLTSTILNSNCQRMSMLLRSEHGLDNAVSIIEGYGGQR